MGPLPGAAHERPSGSDARSDLRGTDHVRRRLDFPEPPVPPFLCWDPCFRSWQCRQSCSLPYGQDPVGITYHAGANNPQSTLNWNRQLRHINTTPDVGIPLTAPGCGGVACKLRRGRNPVGGVICRALQNVGWLQMVISPWSNHVPASFILCAYVCVTVERCKFIRLGRCWSTHSGRCSPHLCIRLVQPELSCWRSCNTASICS